MSAISRIKTWTAEVLTPTDLNAEFDNLVNGVNSLNSANLDMTADYAFTGNISITGSYLKPLILGTLRLWHDSTTGCLRVKYGSNPSTITDGNILMEG